MNVLALFRQRSTAPVARERLHILLSHDRATRLGQRDLLAILREDILSAIARHVTVDLDNVRVEMDRGPATSTLEIEVEIPRSLAS